LSSPFDHAGLRAAVREVLPEAAFQRCYVHFLRNALDHLPRKADDDCLQELRWRACPWAGRRPDPRDRRSIEEARRDLAAWIVKWADRYRKLVAWVEETIEDTIEDTCTFYRLPRQHHKHLKSTDEIDKRFLRRRAICGSRERPRDEARRVGCKRRRASYSFLAGLRRSRAAPFGGRVLQRSTKRA